LGWELAQTQPFSDSSTRCGSRPLAVPHAAEIVRIFSVTDQDPEAAFSYPEYLDLKRSSTLREVGRIRWPGSDAAEGQSRELHTLNLTSSNFFFTALEVKPALGRLFHRRMKPTQTRRPQ